MLGSGRLDVRQRFEVSAAQKQLFPGIILNGQLLTLEERVAEDQCEQSLWKIWIGKPD